MTNLKSAWRALASRRGSTMLAILCLSMGVGTATALFGALDALLFAAPPGLLRGNELVRIRTGGASPAAMAISHPTYRTMADQSARWASIAAYAPRSLSVMGPERSEPIEGVFVSGNYFDVLGVKAAIGRLFTGSEDDRYGAPAVAVLSFREWTRRYGASRDALGSTIELNGRSVQIVGVAPRGFGGVDVQAPDVWLPLAATAFEEFGGERQWSDRNFWLQLFARPVPGVTSGTLERAITSMDRPDGGPTMKIHIEPLRPRFFVNHGGKNPLPLWSAGVALLVVLVACATVANLLLARGAAREREIAIRLALGASRGTVVRQLMLENGLLAFAAAIIGIGISSMVSSLLRLTAVPMVEHAIGIRTTVVALLIAGSSAALFGILPAIWTARGGIDAVLRQGSQRTRSGSQLQRVLIGVQIALGFVLLVGAGLFWTSFRNIRRVDTGFDLDKVATLSFNHRTLPSTQAVEIMERVAQRVGAIPGIESVSLGNMIPFYTLHRRSVAVQDGRSPDEQPGSMLVNWVDPTYFRTLGIARVAGRLFDATDREGAPLVAILGNSVASQYWPDRSPIGDCVELRPAIGECVTIVGVVKDVWFTNLRGESNPIIYLSAAQTPGSAATLFIRSSNPRELAPRISREIQALDRTLPFVNVVPLDDRVRSQRISWEVAALLFAGFATLATALAAIGLYMVIVFIVKERTREVGVRVALGATRKDIMRMVLNEGMRVTSWGLFIGCVVALLGSNLLASQLFGIQPLHVPSYIVAGVLLSGVALLATVLPASRAARIEPMDVLRES